MWSRGAFPVPFHASQDKLPSYVQRIPNGLKVKPLSPEKHAKQFRFRIHASVDVASAVDVINDLGMDTLTFLAVKVLVFPGFKKDQS